MSPRHNQKRMDVIEKERQEQDRQNLQTSLERMVEGIKRSINTNIGNWGEHFPLFMTLTFKQHIKDHAEGNKEFKDFIKRLNYKVTDKKKVVLKYTCVIERQKRKAIHYHVIFYNLSYVPLNQLLEVWQNGNDQKGLRINPIKEIDNIGSYVVKYISKEIQSMKNGGEGKREKEKTIHFQSHGLKKSKEIEMSEQEMAEKMKRLKEQENVRIFETEFENEYMDGIKYSPVI